MVARVEFRLDTKRFERRVQAFIRQNTRRLDQIVFEVAVNVLDDVKRGWPVDTGVSRASWGGPIKGRTAATWRIVNPVPYAVVIEFGGYRGIGPKTAPQGPTVFPDGIRVASGIFPTQKPHAPVRRALSENRNEISRRIERALEQTWGR